MNQSRNKRNTRSKSGTQQTQPTIRINLQSKDIEQAIEKDKKYNKGGITLVPWEGGSDLQYLGDINADQIKFTGIFDKDLKRQGLGLSKWENGDLYLGNFKEDKMDRHGYYEYQPRIEDGKNISEFYWGFWKGGLKNGKGLNLIIKENANTKLFSDFEHSNIDIYFGNIDRDIYEKGLYMQKKEDEYYVYYGEFDSSGRKKGNNCFLYKCSNDTLLYGSVEKDKFKDGFLFAFDENGTIINILKCEMEDGKTITKYESIENANEIGDLKKKVSNIRTILMEKDIFGDIFNKFKENHEFVKTINGISQFESNEYYPKINTFISGYNDFKFLAEIEREIQ